jgi:hypothetical protein
MTAVTAAGFKWPWVRGEIGPRLFVVGSGMLLGALVAAATHSGIRDVWLAFVMGAGAPTTIRGLLTGIEVTPRSPDPPRPRPTKIASEEPQAVREGRDL